MAKNISEFTNYTRNLQTGDLKIFASDGRWNLIKGGMANPNEVLSLANAVKEYSNIVDDMEIKEEAIKKVRGKNIRNALIGLGATVATSTILSGVIGAIGKGIINLAFKGSLIAEIVGGAVVPVIAIATAVYAGRQGVKAIKQHTNYKKQCKKTDEVREEGNEAKQAYAKSKEKNTKLRADFSKEIASGSIENNTKYNQRVNDLIRDIRVDEIASSIQQEEKVSLRR